MIARILNWLFCRPPHTVATDSEGGSCRHMFAITPNDEHDLEHVTREIYIGRGGALCVVLAGDKDHITFYSVATGTTLKIAARRVLACRTSADRIIGLW